MSVSLSPDSGAPWHAVAPDEVFRRLRADDLGLTTAEARRRLQTAGPNVTPSPQRTSSWRILANQFKSVIAGLLVSAATLAWLAGDARDAVAILVVLCLNVALGFGMEVSAQRAVTALASHQARRATVLRDAMPQEVDSSVVVPGDVLALEAGQAVAADARLIDTAELRLLESTLTGESEPVEKNADEILAPQTSLPDRRNMVYVGTTVVAGAGRAIVVATGAATELGHIGALISGTTVQPTPLERRLDVLGRQLAFLAIAIGVITGLLGWWQQVSLGMVLQMSIALAVAAVPEGLPVVATITLAIAVRRMARHGAVVRRLPAVETLGSVTVICTDKTGTLTGGAMVVTTLRTLSRSVDVSGEGYEPQGTFIDGGTAVVPVEDPELAMLLRIGSAASRGTIQQTRLGWTPVGDPTEAALVAVAQKAGIDRHTLLQNLPEIGEVPFSSARAFMATFHSRPEDQRSIAFLKGAPEVVLGLCDQVLERNASRPLTQSDRFSFDRMNRSLAERGLRVLALAWGEVASPSETALTHLTFVGFAGLTDPPAAGVANAIADFRAAGIRTVMLTGDQGGTALGIARQLGLVGDGRTSIAGSEVDRLSDAVLDDRLRSATVFSRVSPEAKLRIVAAFQRRGEVVAMLGDGVNDAAALKKADVGVTMGRRGTDVARETAAVVLTDDRFSTIGVAIQQGRIAFDNIRKFVTYLFSCNLAEIFVIVGATAGGVSPLLPIQILWLNLITDTIPALALAAEPGAENVMRRAPANPAAVSLVRRGHVIVYAALVAAPVFLVLWWSAVSAAAPEETTTMCFMVLAFAQLLHLGNTRDDEAVLRPRRVVANPYALLAVLGCVALQIAAALWTPLRAVLQLSELTLVDWAVVAVLGSVPAVAGQAWKTLRRGNFRIQGGEFPVAP